MYRVLLPVDDDERRAGRQVEFVTSLPGSADEVAVTILHAWGGVIDEDADATMGSQTIEHVKSVRESARQLEEVGIDHEVIDGAGDPGDLILDVIPEVDPDQIVMGRGNRTPVGKAIFGSTTQQVLLNTDVPVVVVGPASEP